jgi:hypothetical protein
MDNICDEHGVHEFLLSSAKNLIDSTGTSSLRTRPYVKKLIYKKHWTCRFYTAERGRSFAL